MHSEGLDISVNDSAPIPTIKLSGEVDFHSASAIREAVSELLRKRKYNLTIDVSHLEFIDSSGLSALLDAAKAAKAQGGDVKLLSPGAQLIHVLTISGFAPYFSITPNNGTRTKRAPKSVTAQAHTSWQVTQFEIPPKTELIADIRNKVAVFAQALPFSKQDIEDIKLAVGEASSNALRYGCPESSNNIVVRCSHNGARLNVQIKDNGPCFNPDEIEPPPIDALDEGGRGIYFMRVLMDEVKFYFSSSGTIVELVKYTPECVEG
ncbi:MAG: anti-sigma factor antagonist [Armatimonadota bacterium]|nr:anti-sigma factor antagonist [Armatimonadota bacterium]